MPQDSLEQLYLDLLGTQVVGFYVRRRRLYDSRAVGPSTAPTRSRSRTNTTTRSRMRTLQRVRRSKKRRREPPCSSARAAVYEGDATLLIIPAGRPAPDSGRIRRRPGRRDRPRIARDPRSGRRRSCRGRLLRPRPARRSSLPVCAADGQGVDALYEDMPDTIEDLHPEQRPARSGRCMLKDLAADGQGTPNWISTRLGEFQPRGGRLGSAPAMTGNAAGWGGDRLAVLHGPDAWP